MARPIEEKRRVFVSRTCFSTWTAYRVRFGASGVFENRLYDGIPNALRALGESGHTLFVVTAKPAVYAQAIVESLSELMQWLDGSGRCPGIGGIGV